MFANSGENTGIGLCWQCYYAF